LETANTRIRHAAHALHTVSPLATLQRGYAIVTHGDKNRIVREATQLKKGETILTRLARGQVQSAVKSIQSDDE